MDNYILIGKIVNTFGIKGELKIISDFEYKNKIFTKNFPIYIGEEKQKELINTVRRHKNYDMILFNEYNNINQVLHYKGKNIYILRSDLQLDNQEILLTDLIGYKVMDNNNCIGTVINFSHEVNNVILKIKGEKIFYIPYIDVFIIKIDKNKKEIITNKGSEFII